MSRRILFSLCTFALLLQTVGCQQGPDADGSNSDEKQGAAETQASSPDETSVSASGFQPLFDQDYEQHQISSRMRQNFQLLRGSIDGEELHKFESAGLEMYQPKNMSPSDRFTGFRAVSEDKQRSLATLLILTNPFSMSRTTQQIVSSAVYQGGSAIMYSERINIDGREGVFYCIRDEIQGKKVAKFITAFGDDEFSWIVSTALTGEQEGQFAEELLRSMLNIKIAETRLPPGEDVDFTIQPNRLVLTDGFVDKVIFTLTGVFPVESTKEPIFQAGRSMVKLPNDEDYRQKLARSLIVPIPEFEVHRVSSEREVTIDNLGGYEFLAVGRDQLSGEPIMIYTVVLFGAEETYVMHGWVVSESSEYINDFRALANSFRRKDQDAEMDPVENQDPAANLDPAENQSGTDADENDSIDQSEND